MILKEGGNIFKDESGTPVTTRINRDDVDTTLAWVEKITGIPHKDFKLGSTGIKSTSGDLDVAVNSAEVDKQELFNKLVAWQQKNHPADEPRQWVAKSGVSVHFKTPINGNPKNGFVQTDLMFGDPDFMKFAYAGTGDNTPYKGAHRAIMIASIAKAQGFSWSPTKGLVDRETKEVITNVPMEIAKRILGPQASVQDMASVEAINKSIRSRDDYEALVADAKENFQKQNLPMPESRGIWAGIKIAESTSVNYLDNRKKNMWQKSASGVRDRFRAFKGGFKAGQQGSISGAASAYKKAGGPQTTIGQVTDKAKALGRKVVGDPAPTAKGGPQAQKKTSMVKGTQVIKVDPDEVKLYLKRGFKVAQAKESIVREGARIDHAEDLVYLQGSKGAMRALASLRNMAGEGGTKDVTLKWDGSPAVIFGRNEDGEFVFTDKSGFVKKGGVGRTTSPDALKQELLGRSGGANKDDPKRIAFADNMAQAFGVFEKAVPQDYRGYFKGDLLYYNTPPTQDKNFVFKPNIVEYAVDVASDLGKKIAKSTAGVVVHRMVAPDGSESPLKDLGIFQGNNLLVVPPVSVETPPEVENAEIERLADLIKKDSADIDSLLDESKLTQMKMKDFPKIIYRYMNSKVDTGLDNLGKDFVKWLTSSNVVSRVKQQKIIDYIKQNMNGWTSLFEVIEGIMKVKNSIISQLDKNSGTVKARTAGQDGGEGYVLAHPAGDIKLVNRAGFSAANRAVER